MNKKIRHSEATQSPKNLVFKENILRRREAAPQDDVVVIKGGYSAKGKKFGIVVSQFNELLTDRLLYGAVDALTRHGARAKDIHVVYAPGAFEIPMLAKRLIQKFRPHAVLTLAVVIRGETKHFDQVVKESARGVMELSKKSEVPVILGMVPADNVDQAIRRVGIKHTNKGREWAMSAVEMANLLNGKLKVRKK